jgi:hypothetical protein
MLREQRLRERQARMRAKIRETAELLAIDEELAQALGGLAEVRVGQRPRRVRRSIRIVNSAVATNGFQQKEQTTDGDERTV